MIIACIAGFVFCIFVVFKILLHKDDGQQS